MRWLVVALLGGAALVGCGDDEPAASMSLQDIPWMLESGPSATFADGRVTGSTGCNQFTAAYTQDGSALEIHPAGATLMACPPPADKVEREYLAALERVAEWRIEGELTGSAGCNTYRATYTTDGARITIGEPAATEKACTAPAGIMKQERAYLSALPRAASYTVEGSRLSLLTAEGTFVATYERTR